MVRAVNEESRQSVESRTDRALRDGGDQRADARTMPVQWMTTILPAIQDLTRRILADEAARAKAADPQVDLAVKVCAKLQVPLSRFTGPAGFLSLLTRALVLAKVEVPSLSVVQVRPDGSLVGFDEIKLDRDAEALEKGRVVLVAHLLGLLATFIGESLTRRLVCDAWPDTPIDNTNLKEEEKP
ncbi:MAG: hypothetical protein ABIN37_09765 [Burkholderiaceae bacterium]